MKKIKSKMIKKYKKELIKEMLELGANENELEFIITIFVINSIKNKRSPKDVAWALLS